MVFNNRLVIHWINCPIKLNTSLKLTSPISLVKCFSVAWAVNGHGEIYYVIPYSTYYHVKIDGTDNNNYRFYGVMIGCI